MDTSRVEKNATSIISQNSRNREIELTVNGELGRCEHYDDIPRVALK